MSKSKKLGKHTPWAVQANDGAEKNSADLNTDSSQADPTVALSDSATGAIDSQGGQKATEALPPVKADRELGFDEDAFAGYEVPAIEPVGVEAKEFDAIPLRKKRRGVKAFVITFLVLAAVLAAVYVGVATMFSTQFMPNTHVAGMDISMKHDDEVAQMLETIPADYKIDVVGGKFSLRATGEDVGMKIDSDAIIAAMHEDQNRWYWPWYVMSANHDETALVETTYDENACNKLVKTAVKTFNKKAKPPTNASIFFDEDAQEFSVKPEEIGTQLAVKAVQGVVRDAVAQRQEKAELTDEQLKQPKLLSTSKKIVNTVDMANGLISTHLELQINGNTIDEIGTDVLSDFVKISDKFEVSLDEGGLAEWVANLASSYDTIGMQRTYTRADGKVITVSGGTYGWEVDEASLRAMIMDAIKEGKSEAIEVPCVDEANVYTGHGERDWGNRYIDVDISEQHVRFYGDDGKIIWESDCISGAPDGEHDTTQGVWYVVMKQSPSKLVGYIGKTKEYETEVQYWMPFVGNGIGFHDATWQPDFGGEMYAQGYGSHGCVNLPYDAAEELYGIIEPGDVVVVHS